ncbi:tetratricopeptide repeat protein [Henriciella sp.]|uniref:tetratricopeptide repeat protein n=1 Tax=Henriciella sp. TaxID=1968823 RepID=UPI002614460E|nr:tetratricopeptide repeat protein [Henriciella sp.]
MSVLLSYIVDATLKGEGERLKGYSIGVDVFERQTDFDPSTDAIVRVQMGRLRRLLDAYYLGDGAYDPVRIRVPKGAYQPEFTLRDVASQPASSAVGPTSGRKPFPERFWMAAVAVLALLIVALGYVALFKDTRLTSPQSETSLKIGSRDTISLAVLPLRGSEANSRSKFVADGISEELVSTLASVPSLTVSSPSAVASALEAGTRDTIELGDALGVDFILEGNLQQDGGRFRIAVQLSDTGTGATIWGETYDTRDENIFDVQDDIIIALVQELRPRLRSAAKEAIARTPTSEQTAWELYLQATWTPGTTINTQAWQLERIALAERALELEPDFAPAHSVMATKLTHLASFVPEYDTPELREKATYHATRALDLSPEDPDVLYNLAIHYVRAGNTDRAQRLMVRVVELDPTRPAPQFLSSALPYYCASAPPAVLERLENFHNSLSADHPLRGVTLYFLGQVQLSRGDYEQAVEQAFAAHEMFRSPETAYLLVAVMIRLGQQDAAVEIYRQQKESWPGLDPHHFADVSIRRRCQGDDGSEEVMRVYSEMADILESPA